MAVIQVNTPGMATTDPGYISSITIRTAGSATVLVPNTTTGQITVDAPCATKVCQMESRFKIVTG
jgi:hypothetical protein